MPVDFPNSRDSRRFAYWGYDAPERELFHLRTGQRIALDTVLKGSNEMLYCILEIHDKPWGNAKVLDELVELLGTHFQGHRLVVSDTRP